MRIEEAPLKLKQGHVQLKTPVKATKDPVFKDYILPNGGHIEGKYVSINAGMIVGADPRLVKTQGWETTEYTQPLTDSTREKIKQKEAEKTEQKSEVEYNAKLYAFMANTFPKFINSLPRNRQSTEEHKIKELLNTPANNKMVNLRNASDYIKNFKVEPLNEASMGQEQKKLIASKLKPVLAKYGIKGTLSVRNGSTISLSIVEGTIDFIGNAANVMATQVIDKPHYYSVVKNLLKYNEVQVNDRQIASQFSGNAKTALLAISKVLNINNYSKSDWTNDWVQVGHHVNINIGKIDKPYKCTGTPEKPNTQLQTILGDEPIKESTLYEDIDEHNFVKKCREVGQNYGVKIEVHAPTETTGKNTWVINIVAGKLDFVSNFVDTALRTKVASADIIEIANSKEWVTVHNKNYPQQFSGEPLKCVSELMKIGKQYVVAPNQLKVYIGGRMKRYSYLGPKKKITEDAKQLIQNPILKVFDQFGKQYLAQVLDASLNKMIQAATRRGVKVTVPQLIAEIKDKPNGTTSQALFKAMATVIKQVSAQIPTIVTKNVSSIS